MNTITNTNVEYKRNSLRKKPTFGIDNSYRIFHITRKQIEDSDDDHNEHRPKTHTISNEHQIKPTERKKSFKISTRSGFIGLERRSTKNKRLLFLHKTSCESTSMEAKTPPSSNVLINDLSQSIISNNTASIQLSMKNKNQQNPGKNMDESSEANALIESLEDTIDHDDKTLDNLLARACQLETTVKQQEFNRVQHVSRTSIQRKRKRFFIACTIVLLISTMVLTIIIFGVIMTIKYKVQRKQVSKSG